MSAGADRAPSRVLALALIWRLALANVVAGFIVVTYFVLSAELNQRISRTRNIGLTAAVFVGLTCVFLVLAAVRSKQLFMPTWRWLDEQRDPTAEEAAEVVHQPLRIALFPLRYWLAAAVLNLLSFFVNQNGKAAIFTSTGTVLGGLVASATGYFLADRLLRGPRITALARHDVSLPASGTVGRRLLLVWGLGSGIPLLGVVITPLIVDHPDLPVSIPMAFLAGAGFFGGVLLTTMVARSIAEPVKDVREALVRVASGDLDARVVVDDAGELGQLQRGFNEMVDGLREREQLADLFGRHAAVVVACIDAEGGWVNKFEGDGALCVFGAPIELDDHARRSLRAARQLAVKLEDLAVRHPGLEAGIGVSSGEAVAGNVGAEQRLEYTVIGQPVHEASRLSSAAKTRPCRVLASKAAVDHAGDEASRWMDAGTLALHGIAPDFAVCEPPLVACLPMPRADIALPQGDEKVRAVRTMFDAIAPRYDLVNRIMTFRMDVGWRRRTVRALRLAPRAKVVDLACGTGDLCDELARSGYVALGVDLSFGMLAAAHTTAPLVQADALRLSMPDASADGATCGFALRNFCALEPFLASLARVVRPGGRIALLEVSTPTNRLLRWGHSVYFGHVVPRIGAVLSDGAAYRYLPKSVAYLPEPAALLTMVRAAGFDDVRRDPLSGGIAQLITGTRS